MLIVLTGIDGSGKTTAARAAVTAARREGKEALLLRNYAGRRRMSLLSTQFGIQLHPRLADAVETVIRTANVMVSHARAHRHPGLVIMDRHLHCQLALRQARGLPRGRLLPFLLTKFPQPDVVVHLVIDPEQAHQRVLARGTDTETLEELNSLRAAYQSHARIRALHRTGCVRYTGGSGRQADARHRRCRQEPRRRPGPGTIEPAHQGR